MLDLPPLISTEPPPTPDFEAFRHRAYAITGLDLTCYKAPQMQRRLCALLARLEVGSFADYAQLLERDAQRRQEFRDYVTINVSEFFRDSERFDELERRVLPDLLAGGATLRVWSAGCSIGAEPYSLAIILRELGPGRPHSILATDVDQTILERARVASGYLAADLRNVSPSRLERWFVANADGRYTLGRVPRSMASSRWATTGRASSSGAAATSCSGESTRRAGSRVSITRHPPCGRSRARASSGRATGGA